MSRTSTRAYAEAEQLFQPPPPPPRSTNPYAGDQRQRSVFVEEAEPEESEETHKGVGMYAAVGAVALLLVAGGLGYYKMRPKTTATVPTQTVSQQTTTMVPSTTTTTTTVVTPPKPTAATSATAATSQPVQTPVTETAVPEKPARSQADVVHQLNAPSRIPIDLRTLAGKEPPPSSGFGGVDSMGGASAVGNVFGGQSGPKVKVEAPRKLTISAGVAGGLLIQKTAPVYPQLAKEARVSGTVVIQATISRTGSIQNLRVVNGPTMLRQPALDAVKSWRYRPYLLDGEPVEVETTVSVTFTLGG
ncbi:MAG: TonB family protein [Terracidiphilus sp.]